MNAVKLAEELGISSLAFPIIGAGSGGFNVEKAESVMLNTLNGLESGIEVRVVRHLL